jgi:hypothetical protein
VSSAIYPAPPSAPLRVPAATAGPLTEIAEHASIDPATGRLLMIMRLVQIDAGDGPSPPPSIRMAVDAGPATTIGTQPTPLPGQPAGVAAALATLGAVTDGVHAVEIEVLQPNRTWRIQIVNTDVVDHRYTCVVGDTDQATLQPWLDIPVPTLTFEALVGETTPAQDLPLANYGPGPLTVHDPDGADLGAGFRLVAVTPRVIGGNRRAVASITFTAPDTPGTPSTTHHVASSDPAAGTALGHSNRVTLAATVRLGWTVRGEVRRSDILDSQGNRAYELDKNYGPLLITATIPRPGSVSFSVQMPQFVPFPDSQRAVAVWVRVDGYELLELRLSNWMLPAPTWTRSDSLRLAPGPFDVTIESGESDGAGWPEPTEPVLVGDIAVALDP